ncbi:hypothetical protein OnM2_012020 [Erysiphe neolycopersici]|uniref:Uncharacterized protein n=1 Tax=Erysiphe neolycopersici TaxID=212602 RepID=A0A420I604_9PEZI|nr:hypothetical protein OnM2_012020 [Erysiphe neolycopersici]
MIEKAIDIFQRVLKKMIKDFSKWSQNVPQAVFEILIGFEPTGAIARNYLEYKRQALSATINLLEDILPG